MKNFFATVVAFSLVFFQLVTNAKADPWGISEQDDWVSSPCGEFTHYNDSESNPLSEFRIYFNNAESGTNSETPPRSCDYSKVTQHLRQHYNDIAGVIVIGSADTKRADGDERKNVELSVKRVKYVLNNILPDLISNWCSLDGYQMEHCAVYAMGSANDYAMSGYTRNNTDSNADERAVRVYIRWRFAKCPESLTASADKYLAALGEAKKKYTNVTDKITKAEQTVREAKEICKSKILYASQVEDILARYNNMLELGLIIPEIKTINNQYNIIKAKIESLYASLMSGKRSEWRNAQGEFNTARLASDSIAGIVLGTAGGLITSTIVKKNQLKQGFEDINCAIGGQTVANYGDTMNVGLQ